MEGLLHGVLVDKDELLCQEAKEIEVKYIATAEPLADSFTKPIHVFLRMKRLLLCKFRKSNFLFHLIFSKFRSNQHIRSTQEMQHSVLQENSVILLIQLVCYFSSVLAILNLIIFL